MTWEQLLHALDPFIAIAILVAVLRGGNAFVLAAANRGSSITLPSPPCVPEPGARPFTMPSDPRKTERPERVGKGLCDAPKSR